jgi:hypothetical protein
MSTLITRRAFVLSIDGEFDGDVVGVVVGDGAEGITTVEGEIEGTKLGSSLGIILGPSLGYMLGPSLGIELVGPSLGIEDSPSEGALVGDKVMSTASLGCAVGDLEVWLVGTALGEDDGETLEAALGGVVGGAVGEADAMAFGCALGDAVGVCVGEDETEGEGLGARIAKSPSLSPFTRSCSPSSNN